MFLESKYTFFFINDIKNYENQRKKAKACEIYGIKKPSLVFVSISIFFALLSLSCALSCFFMYIHLFTIQQSFVFYLIVLFIILPVVSTIMNIIYHHKTQNCPL